MGKSYIRMDLPAFLNPANISWSIENVSRSGGPATNGQEQVVSSGVGRWVCDLSGFPILPENVPAFRAFISRMYGRAGVVNVPAFDLYQPWPVDAYGRSLNPKNVRRRSLDGTPYQDPEIPEESRIVASFLAAAARRATTVRIGMTKGSGIVPGHYFSPVPGRLHMVSEALGNSTYRIEPPLREAVSKGSPVDFSTPSCAMRFADDGQGSLNLQYGRYGFVDLSFTEAL